MRLETVFDAGAHKPAVFRARPVPSLAESRSSARPTRVARGPNPVLTNRAEGRKRKRVHLCGAVYPATAELAVDGESGPNADTLSAVSARSGGSVSLSRDGWWSLSERSGHCSALTRNGSVAIDLSCVKTQKIEKRREWFFLDRAKSGAPKNIRAPQCALEKCLFYRLRAPSRFHTAKTLSRHSPLHFAVMHNASVRPPIC